MSTACCSRRCAVRCAGWCSASRAPEPLGGPRRPQGTARRAPAANQWRELVKGWNTWVGQFEALAGIRRAVRHLVNRHLSRAGRRAEMARYLKALPRRELLCPPRPAQSWVVWMASGRARPRSHRADSGRKRAIQRLKNMQVRAWTSGGGCTRAPQDGALRRLTHRHLAYDGRGGRDVAERHRLLRLVRKGTTFFLDRAVGLAFNAWRAEVERTLSEAYSDYAGYYYNPAMTGPVTPLREPDRPTRGVDAIPFWPVEDLPTEAPRPPLSKRCMPRCRPKAAVATGGYRRAARVCRPLPPLTTLQSRSTAAPTRRSNGRTKRLSRRATAATRARRSSRSTPRLGGCPSRWATVPTMAEAVAAVPLRARSPSDSTRQSRPPPRCAGPVRPASLTSRARRPPQGAVRAAVARLRPHLAAAWSLAVTSTSMYFDNDQGSML